MSVSIFNPQLAADQALGFISGSRPHAAGTLRSTNTVEIAEVSVLRHPPWSRWTRPLVLH